MKEAEESVGSKRKPEAELGCKMKKAKSSASITRIEEKKRKRQKKADPILEGVHIGSSLRPVENATLELVTYSLPPTGSQRNPSPASPPLPGIEGRPSRSGEAILLEEEELAKQLKFIFPEGEKDVEVIWRGNFSMNDPDGFVAHVPKFGAVQKGEGSSSDWAQYAREIYRATTTPSQKLSLANNPKKALDNVMNAMHGMGVVLGHFKDVYDAGECGVDFARGNPAVTRKAIIEKNYFYDQAVGYKKKCEIVESEVSSLKSQVTSLEKLKEVDRLNLTAHQGKLKEVNGKLAAKYAELAEKDAALAAKDTEIAQFLQEKKSGPEHVLEFLRSQSFKRVAPHVCIQLMWYSMYEQLKKLGKSFPFTPEHLGYAPVPEEEADVMALLGYTWHSERDVLWDAEGNPMVE